MHFSPFRSSCMFFWLWSQQMLLSKDTIQIISLFQTNVFQSTDNSSVCSGFTNGLENEGKSYTLFYKRPSACWTLNHRYTRTNESIWISFPCTSAPRALLFVMDSTLTGRTLIPKVRQTKKAQTEILYVHEFMATHVNRVFLVILKLS